MTPRGREQGAGAHRARRRWWWCEERGEGRGTALAVSSEGLLEDSVGAQRGPRVPCHQGEALECTDTQ